MTERQVDVLRSLGSTEAVGRWVTPMMIGGRDGSHHSATLAQLVDKGLVERKKSHAIYCPHGTYYVVDNKGQVVRVKKPIQRCRCKGSCSYRITRAGRRVLKRARA